MNILIRFKINLLNELQTVIHVDSVETNNLLISRTLSVFN